MYIDIKKLNEVGIQVSLEKDIDRVNFSISEESELYTKSLIEVIPESIEDEDRDKLAEKAVNDYFKLLIVNAIK